MQLIDNPRGGAHKIRDPRLALAQGELHVDDVTALEVFDQSFRFDPPAVERARQRFEAATGTADVRQSAAAGFAIHYLLEEAFVGSPGPAEKIYFNIVGEGEFTVGVTPDEFSLSEGLDPAATARMVCSRDTFAAMTLFKVMEARSLHGANNNSVGRELSDHQLASVAGGKGSDPGCFGDTGCGGDILVVGCRSDYDCGGDILVVGCREDYYCPADFDACAGDFCGDNSCGSDIGAGGGCGSDNCLAAGCTADGCGSATCGADACAAAACPYDACGAAACFQDTCGIAGCSANACGGAACGADFAQGPCAIDACWLNVLPN